MTDRPEPITIQRTDKALNKSEAYHLARLLITDPEAVSMAERRGLLLHFAPTTGRVPKTAQEYVAQFVAGAGEVRYWLQYLFSDGKRLWATDGHTAAWCPTDLEPGAYHPRTGDPVEVDGKFPNMQRVIPARHKQHLLNLQDWPGEEHQGIKRPELYLQSPGGVYFARDRILRAVKGAASAVFQEPDGPRGALRGSVKLKGDGGSAQFVVMPVHPNN